MEHEWQEQKEMRTPSSGKRQSMAALALTSSAPHLLNLGGRSRLAHLGAGDHFGQVGGLPDGQG